MDNIEIKTNEATSRVSPIKSFSFPFRIYFKRKITGYWKI